MNPCERQISNELHALAAEFRAFKETMAERDLRYKERFEAQEKALTVAEASNLHWKSEADQWRKRADERELNFLPRSLGYILSGVGIMAGVVSLVLTIADKVK